MLFSFLYWGGVKKTSNMPIRFGCSLVVVLVSLTVLAFGVEKCLDYEFVIVLTGCRLFGCSSFGSILCFDCSNNFEKKRNLPHCECDMTEEISIHLV